jgi:uncharacterized protein
MQGYKSDLVAVLRKFNPWWKEELYTELPQWKRAAFSELYQWTKNPPAPRAVLLSGARQIGKTTLLLQTIGKLIDEGIPPKNIIYVTFDHPLLKLLGLNGLIDLWSEIEPLREGVEYLFLDEIQYTKDWQVWLKHEVDFNKTRRIIVTGSATPLNAEGQESGMGRWHTIKLATLSFYEFLQIKKIKIPSLPSIRFPLLRKWKKHDFLNISEDAKPLAGYFNDYLLRGGFPQCALVDSLTIAQKLLREDIVDKVLKRDMTALYGVRRVVELEQTFLYLCLHDGGLLDMTELCSNLQVKRPTAVNYISLLENAHLIYRLPPFGYGKEVLRGKFKIYLADAAIAPSVMLKGKELLEDPTGMGVAVETAYFKHVFTRYYKQTIGFSYWRKNNNLEVDIIAQMGGTLSPMEVKYRQSTEIGDLKGLLEFGMERQLPYGYVITRDLTDFGVIKHTLKNGAPFEIVKIPAALACYWLGREEMENVID